MEITESLQESCEQKLMKMTDQHELKCLAVFASCASTVASATDTESSQHLPKTNFKFGTLVITADAIHMTTNFHWLCDYATDKNPSNSSMTQPMSNLVELENVTRNSFTFSFMDELENTIEKWRFEFESYPRIARTLETVDEIWQKIFCVPLIGDDQKF